MFSLLLTMVLGITEFGLAFSAQTRISMAAREAARNMAVGGTTTTARSAAKSAAAGIALTDAQITFSQSTCVGVASGVTETVTISFPYTFITNKFGTGVTLNGSGVMRCEG